MKLIYLYLKGFKPLSLSNIEEFTYSPQAPWQLILGTNGSGKSSILRAATPTVTDKSEFRKGGSKISHWLAEDGTLYELESHYNSSVRHSFKRGGKELNDGGTSTVQTELVEMHLAYTKALHVLLTQQLSFTQMSRSARENLLLDISGVDFDYALTLFDSIKKSQRDTTGAIKHVAVKYSELCNRLDSMGDMEELSKRVNDGEAKLTKLLSYTNFSLLDNNPIDSKLQANYKLLEEVSKRADRVRSQIAAYTSDMLVFESDYGSHENFKEVIRKHRHDLTTVSEEMGKVETELSELQNIVERLNECPESIDLASLDSRISNLQCEINSWVSSLNCEHITLDMAQQRIQASIVRMNDFSERVPTDLASFTRDEVNKAIELSLFHKQRVSELKEKIDKRDELLTHARLAKQSDAVCPKCDTRILSNSSLDDSQMTMLQDALETERSDLVRFESFLADAVKAEHKAQTFAAFVKEIQNIAMQHPELTNLWTSVGTASDMIKSPTIVLQNLSNELNAVMSERALVQKKEELNKLLEYQYLAKLSESDNAVSRYNTLRKQYDAFTIRKTNIVQSINVFKKLDTLYDEFGLYVGKLDEAVVERERLFLEWINTEGTLEVTTYVRDQQSKLGAMRKALAQWEELTTRKEYLASEGNELKAKKEELDTLLKALSPTTGLIGDQLRSTLNIFCKQVNHILGSIWEHELAISVPEDETKLSFNFNLHVDGETREDVKKGSTGEQDVINMAVIMVIMAQKGLQGYPLFMDEVGSSFDYTHRKNLLAFIKGLISNGTISQLFMVNHFSSEYGGIANSDTIVLNNANVQITSPHNEVVIMK